MRIVDRYRELAGQIARFGFMKGLVYLFDAVLNRLIFFHCLHLFFLDRTQVKRPPVIDSELLSFRLTTVDDLPGILDQAKHQIDELNRGYILSGTQKNDLLFLTYVGTELAGLTCVHLRGRPKLPFGLRLRLPDSVIYNYGAFTFPKFRGRNHQGLRHYELLHQPQCEDSTGLIGNVLYTNFRSLRGVKKSGYRLLGKIRYFRIRGRYFVWLSRGLKRFGVGKYSSAEE